MILAGEMMVPPTHTFPKSLYHVLHVWVTTSVSSVYFHPSPPSLHAQGSSTPVPHPLLRVFQACAVLYTLKLHSELHPHNRRERDFAESPLYQLKPKLFSATCFWAHWEFVLLPDTLTLHRHFLIHLYKNEGETMIILVFIRARLEELVRLLCQERFLLALEVSPDLGL